MSPRIIRVAVMHDDFIVQAGLEATFSARADLHVERGVSVAADVVVTDFRNGLQRLCAGEAATPRVMILARDGREWQIREALRRGAAAFVGSDVTAQELVDAVHAVHAGGTYLDPRTLSQLVESLSTQPLTAREEQVLSLIGDGLCNKRIATRLQISLGTVKVHVRSLFGKLEVRSRVAAIVAADRRGLIRRDGGASNRPQAACDREPRPFTALRA